MDISESWWIDFFKGPFGDLQLQENRQQATVSDVDRIANVIGPAPQKILDAPCGTGRHALELARRGYRVLGIDFNPKLLEAARTKSDEQSLATDFQLADLREFSAEEEFDAALCLWTSVGYFSDSDNERMLHNLVKAVKPGGHLILDVVVLESLCPIFSTRGWSWWGEGDNRVRVCEERAWDAERSRINVRWTFIHDQREQTRDSSIRVYTCHELITILRAGGISTFNCLGKHGEPFQIGSPKLWLEARKAG